MTSRRHVRAALAGAGVLALSAATTSASATPSDPSFQVTDIHYTVVASGSLAHRISALSFELQANSPVEVRAWFNTATPAADRVYSCSRSSMIWTCAAPSSAADNGLMHAKQLYVEVDGETRVLGETIVRHHNDSGSVEISNHTSRGGLPFTGADVVVELVAAACLLTCGSMLLVASRTAVRHMPDADR